MSQWPFRQSGNWMPFMAGELDHVDGLHGQKTGRDSCRMLGLAWNGGRVNTLTVNTVNCTRRHGTGYCHERHRPAESLTQREEATTRSIEICWRSPARRTTGSQRSLIGTRPTVAISEGIAPGISVV